MSFYKYISKRLYDQSFILNNYTNNKQFRNVLRCYHLPPPPPLVVGNAKRSEEHLIAKFSQLVKMKEIYLRRY